MWQDIIYKNTHTIPIMSQYNTIFTAILLASALRLSSICAAAQASSALLRSSSTSYPAVASSYGGHSEGQASNNTPLFPASLLACIRALPVHSPATTPRGSRQNLEDAVYDINAYLARAGRPEIQLLTSGKFINFGAKPAVQSLSLHGTHLDTFCDNGKIITSHARFEDGCERRCTWNLETGERKIFNIKQEHNGTAHALYELHNAVGYQESPDRLLYTRSSQYMWDKKYDCLIWDAHYNCHILAGTTYIWSRHAHKNISIPISFMVSRKYLEYNERIVGEIGDNKACIYSFPQVAIPDVQWQQLSKNQIIALAQQLSAQSLGIKK